MEQQIKLRQREVNRLLRSAQRNLSQQRKELDKRLETAMSSLSDYPEKELQLARHMRDVETNQKLFAFLLEKHQEARILEASTTTDKRIVDAADLPWRKTSPARGKLVLSGLLGGLMAAFGAVYLAHLLQRRLETVEAVKNALGFPVYGTVPVAVGGNGKKKSKKKPAHDKRLSPAAVWDDSHGPMAEAFRAMAVNVSLMPAGPGRGRIVQVTSSQPAEGKSTIISNLAVALSKAGASVLVVDLDLRKPVQHRVWGMRRSPGYADLIAKGEGPKQAVACLQKKKEFDIDVLTAGTKLPDSLRVLMNTTLEAMLVYWSERYDYVLVDSPPAFVADTTVVAKHADLVLVVARPGVVERGNVKQALESLNRVEAAKGLVLSAVERKHAEYYYGNAYYYQQSYGSPSEDSSDDGDQQAAS
jgi:tyrosine-protein kinase Etk/Wzc